MVQTESYLDAATGEASPPKGDSRVDEQTSRLVTHKTLMCYVVGLPKSLVRAISHSIVPPTTFPSVASYHVLNQDPLTSDLG
jgi:hypothetical protein